MPYLEVFIASLRLGLTSFGGPIAHLGYFHEEYVKKRNWISDSKYADLVALCQFLPGPASSQVGMAIGYLRAGFLGALLSWVGFTLPSAVIMIVFGMGVKTLSLSDHRSWIHSLKVVAVAVVAQAVFLMGKKLCPDAKRAFISIVSAILLHFYNSTVIQIIALISGGIFGLCFFNSFEKTELSDFRENKNRFSFLYLIIFLIILIALPLISKIYPTPTIKIIDSFYRAGSLVFGGGHVVLPLLQTDLVPSGLISNDLFLAGYGIANAVPGPLFTFSAYLGYVFTIFPNGLIGSLICLIAIFLPSFLLILGFLPFWNDLSKNEYVRRAMLGTNAAVVGVLLAALYNPVIKSAIFEPTDLLLAVAAFVMLEKFKVSSLIVVVLVVIFGILIY
ncbi:MAG TPA: chromate efflux transporter [Oligoflexia bacterium]|nr:chromate efflux transporter [Oligoflexia bacterium]HMP48891.1 chromate efflux transporter [Oligoflexia bacterium]